MLANVGRRKISKSRHRGSYLSCLTEICSRRRVEAVDRLDEEEYEARRELPIRHQELGREGVQ